MSWRWFIASASTLLTLMISIVNIFHQYMNLINPKIQLCICRILTMIPVYAILSYLSCITVEYSVPLSIIRDCYEAYVMHSFLQLLIIYVGGDFEVVKILINSKNASGEIWPQYYFKNILYHFKNNSVDSEGEIYNNNVRNKTLYHETNNNYNEVKHKMSRFYSYIKLGVLQFVIIKPLTAIVSLLLENIGYYKPGTFSYKDGFLYMITINMISVSVSVYSLFLLYISLVKELLPIKPVLKFFCIKFIIFVSFWQSIILSMFNHSNIYSNNDPKYIIKLHNWLLTIEMTFCAVIFGIAFRVDKSLNNNVNLNNKDLSINSSDNQNSPNDYDVGKRYTVNHFDNINTNNNENPFINNYVRNKYSKKDYSSLTKDAEITQKRVYLKRYTKKFVSGIINIFDPLDIIKDSIFLFKSLNNPSYNYINENSMHYFGGAITC
ncbi:hypothetical protein FG379_002256 [Cryptosporidium bovis]|uniref:uncharacterized protein n=1 Tax=Cryptosporidium bovis TaxID=310047 RepID=UPI003519EC85|nr:hypothetical protein FG379_002256 [Cryptosporidium bovis]